MNRRSPLNKTVGFCLLLSCNNTTDEPVTRGVPCIPAKAEQLAKESAMSATLALVSSTTTKAATKTTRFQPLTAAMAAVALQRRLDRAEGPAAEAAATKALEGALTDLVRQVMGENPQEAAKASELAYLAARANEAHAAGRLDLATRNRYATRASEARQVIMGLAQGCLDRFAKRGEPVYLAQSWVPELHQVA